jgi:hypothetical protein
VLVGTIWYVYLGIGAVGPALRRGAWAVGGLQPVLCSDGDGHVQRVQEFRKMGHVRRRAARAMTCETERGFLLHCP